MGAAVCPRCRGVVALHEGRPYVSENGAIELWHSSCFAIRHARAAEEVTVVAFEPRRDVRSFIAGAGVFVAITAFAIGAYAMRAKPPTASLASIELATSEPLGLRAFISGQEDPPLEIDVRDRYPVALVEGMPMDEVFPSLLDWIHPVTDADHVLPPQSGGRFGSERGHVKRTECGDGHCGVDLGGPVGRAVVAVTDGVVVRVERSEHGRDGRSGRYVRIEHADGSLTAYMHLDAVVEGLEVGDRVDGGQQIGTLGATGIHTAAPHLHFSLELPKVPGTHGDHVNTYYVDPAPFLVRASIARAPDRRHAVKPAL